MDTAFSKASSDKEITRQSYQSTAQEFADNVADLAPLESINKFMSFLPPQPKILELGSGSGRDAKIFSELGADILGIDYSSKLIDIAKAHAPLANFQLMDVEDIDFPAEYFDGVWAVCILGHVNKKNLPALLKKIYNTLKSGGHFHLAVKKGSGEGLIADTRYLDNPQKFWSFFEREEIALLLESAQFKITELSLVEKNNPYQTQAAFRIFCQKP